MLANRISSDPWLQTVHLLKALASSRNGGCAETSSLKAAARDARNAGYSKGARTLESTFVRVVDRPTFVTAVVDWRDATTGCYAEQTWRAGRARRCGLCALSGAPIAAGDAVYRPRITKHFRANAESMILASAVNAAKERDQ